MRSPTLLLLGVLATVAAFPADTALDSPLALDLSRERR
jgi:hypothetical protein